MTALKGLVVLFLAIVGEAKIVIEHERVQLGVFFHGRKDILICEVAHVEDIAEIVVYLFIIVLVFTSFEVTVHSRLLVIHLNIADANVVVAVDETRSYLEALDILWNRLQAFMTKTDFINHPHVFREFFSHHFELRYLFIIILLVSCNYVMRIHVFRVHYQYLFGHDDCLRFLNPTKFMSHSDEDIGIDEGGPFLYGLNVTFDRLFESELAVQNIAISYKQLNRLIKTNHILVPKGAAIALLLIGDINGVEAEGKRVEGIAPDLASCALLVIPTVSEPFVPADSVISVPQASNVEANRVPFLNHLLIDANGLYKFVILEECITGLLHLFEVWFRNGFGALYLGLLSDGKGSGFKNCLVTLTFLFII